MRSLAKLAQLLEMAIKLFNHPDSFNLEHFHYLVDKIVNNGERVIVLLSRFGQVEDQIRRYPHVRETHLYNRRYSENQKWAFCNITLLYNFNVVNCMNCEKKPIQKLFQGKDTYLSTASTYSFLEFL